MIELPRRSVTRFFIPLIDVLTLLFCIFLMMPLVRATGDEAETGADGSDEPKLTAEEKAALAAVRQGRQATAELDVLRAEQQRVAADLDRLRRERTALLSQRLAVQVLEIGADGRLFAYDPDRDADRREELTPATVRAFIDRFQAQVRAEPGGREPYFLLMYPRPAAGSPAFPLRRQREEYDRWFDGVAHGYDIPLRGR